MAVKIKIAKAHENQLNDEEIKRELTEVQEFFNTTDFQYSEGTINFIMLRAIYTHIKRSMIIIGVYVNKTDKCVHGLGSELNLKFKKLNAKILTINTTFPEEFIGKLDIDDGLLIHIEVPVIGLERDAVFNINDISGELSNIKLII